MDSPKACKKIAAIEMPQGLRLSLTRDISESLQQPHLSKNELQEGGLSGSVGPDESQPRVEVETELQVSVDPRRLVAVPEAHVLR